MQRLSKKLPRFDCAAQNAAPLSALGLLFEEN